jgi:hypothetical protein
VTVDRPNSTSRVDRIVRRSAAELTPDARGDVLLLGRPESCRWGPAVSSLRHHRDPGELGVVAPVDTIVSVCELWRPEWDPRQLGALAGRLRPGGRLLFVEPVSVTGASGVVQRLAELATPWRRRRLRFARALPDELRAAGFVPVRIDRICADRVGRVRSFVVGIAVAG